MQRLPYLLMVRKVDVEWAVGGGGGRSCELEEGGEMS